MSVRPALLCDFDDLIRLLLAFHQENPLAPLDIERTSEYLFDLIEADHVFCALDDRGAIVGALGIAESPLWFSDRIDLYDLFFFVYEGHRDGGQGTALVDAYIEYALAAGQVAFLTVMSEHRARGRVATVHRFDPVGYRVRLTAGDEDVPLRRVERN